MDNVEIYFRDIIKEKETVINSFENNVNNYFNDIIYFSKIHKQYENELERFTSLKFNVFRYINANQTQNSSTIIQDKMNFNYDNAHSYQSFNGRNILSWKPGIWYDMLSFNLIEEDGGRTTTITLNSKYKQKNDENSAFGSDLSINHTLEIKNNDENCGNAYYTYYDPSTTWIYFPNYGARIKVSDIDQIESYNTTDGF